MEKDKELEEGEMFKIFVLCPNTRFHHLDTYMLG